jgi:hypothetical protein
MDYLQNSNSSSSCAEYLLWKLENRLESKCMRLKTFLTSFDLHFRTTPFWKSICPSYRAPFTWLWSRLWSPLTTRVKISHFVASVPTSCQEVAFTMLVPSCHQACHKLLTTCNNLADIIRLVAKLFQQVRYSHDITILYTSC